MTDTMHPYRTHTCDAPRPEHVGQTVRLSGWVHRKRDHGNLLFIDLRDHYGITQCVIDTSSELFPTVEGARPESVLTITGEVVERSAETINTNIPTGQVEIRIRAVTVEGPAEILPMQVAGDQEYGEDVRLRYRFLDLRREKMQKNIKLWNGVIASIRRRMTDIGFLEFQTPILTASSPEGARDYLVPARNHPGKFYALPQAPQQFKQLLMVSGFDKYFQIAPCFRDEDARADRSPGEFYQLDFEMSFVTQEDVFRTIEPVIAGVFEEFADGRTVTATPFPEIPYRESMLKYGSDKPDLRNPIIISDVTECYRDGGFGLFAKLVGEKGATVRAIPAPGAADRPRSFFDKLNDWAREEGQGGLGYIVFGADGETKGPIAKIWKQIVRPRSRKRPASRTAMPCSLSARPAMPVPSLPVRFATGSAMSLRSVKRAASSSAGSSITRCTNWTTTARSSFRTTRSRCRKVALNRLKPKTRWMYSPISTTSSATA